MIRKIIISLYAVLISVLAFAGGGWPQPKGKGYYKFSEWWLVSDQHFTSSGKIDPNATRGTFTTSFYGEYGITNRVTGIMYLPFFVRTYQNKQVSGTTGETLGKGEALNSIGDAEIGFKYGLSNPGSKFAVATTLKLGIPLGESQGGSDGSFQTGDGEFNQMILLDISKSMKIGNVSAFATVYSGFNNRTNDFSDELRYGAEIGASFIQSKLWVFTKFNAIESLKNGSKSPQGSGSIFANNTEYASYTLETAYYMTEKLGISASYSGAISGEIIFADPAYSVGIFLDIK